MSAMLPAIVIVAIIAGVLIGLLGRYWAIRRGDVDTPREPVKPATKKRPSENVSDGLFTWRKA